MFEKIHIVSYKINTHTVYTHNKSLYSVIDYDLRMIVKL